VPTPLEVVETVFTSPNPETGSEPPPEVAWALFKNGTAYVAVPDEELDATASVEQVADAARAALQAHQSGDFTVSRISGWYPDDPVWLIWLDDGLFAVVIEDYPHEITAGVVGRAARELDSASPELVYVRNFRGEQGP